MTNQIGSGLPPLMAVDVDDELRALVARFPLPGGIDDADMNQDEMAAALQTTVNTLGKWMRNEGMPIAQEGGPGKPYVLRLSHCYAWAKAREIDESVRKQHNAAQIHGLQAEFLGMEINDPKAQLSAKDRRALADADVAHSRAMHMRRQLIPMEETVELLESLCKMVRNKMEAMPDLLERELSLKPSEVEKVQRISVDLLSSLADMIEERELTERNVPDVEVQKQWMI